MPPLRALFAAALLVPLTISGCGTPRVAAKVDDAAAAPLVDTRWRLTQLGSQVIANPEGADGVGLRLDPQNPRITGFGGCNRLFGGYLLDGEQLKFDQVGATRMACVDSARMTLEQEYFQMLAQVARWKIRGSELQLASADGATLATFTANQPAGR